MLTRRLDEPRGARRRPRRRSEAVYWSRSRKKLWRKGEESGLHAEGARSCASTATPTRSCCKVEQVGGIACHTGRESCFFRKLENGKWVTVDPVLKDPALIYKKK